MARKAEELGPLAVSRLTKAGLHAVGGVSGLYLQVLPSGARTWVLRAMIGSKRRDMGLGGYPDVPLKEAREAARSARARIRDGADPIEERKARRSALMAEAARVMTFEEAAKAYTSAHDRAWRNPKHRQQWSNTLATYAFPKIGKLAVSDVEVGQVLQILEPIWTAKTTTATRVRGRIESVLDWATARGYRTGLNPARWRGHLDKMLAKPSKVSKVKHYDALAVDDIAGFIPRLRAADGMGARALEFAILTAARSGEVRGAKWSEINLKDQIWTVPADRMKAGREHRVPLSDAAAKLLEALPTFGASDLVFPSTKGAPLSDMTLSAVLRRMEVPAVPHGFRSTFRDWAAERTNYPREAAEMALAHTIENKVEAAYRRGDLFEKRRRMMQDWAAFIEQPTVQGNVVNLRDGAA